MHSNELTQTNNARRGLFVGAFIITVAFLVPFVSWSVTNLLTLLGFYSISLFSFYFLWSDHRPYSIYQMFWIFCLIFLGLIPSFQFRFHAYPWDVPVQLPYIHTAQVLTLLCMSVFGLAYHYIPLKAAPITDFSVSLQQYYRIGLPLFFIAGIVIIFFVGVENLWSRSALEQSVARYEQSVYLLITGLCRAWMILLFLLSLHLFLQRKISSALMMVLLAAMLITHFPLSINRTYLAIVWGGAALVYLPFWKKKTHLFRSFILITLLLLFPLLNQVRFINSDSKYRAHSLREAVAHSFAGGDFDAFTNLTHTISYVEEKGTTRGGQMASALLFFVPRKYWKEKSTGSGFYVYAHHGSNFRNVSSPLPAEGFINFGWMGSFLFVGLMALFARWQDGCQWELPRNYSKASLLYPILLMWSFFFLRGDMMSGIALLTSILLAAVLSQWLLDAKGHAT